MDSVLVSINVSVHLIVFLVAFAFLVFAVKVVHAEFAERVKSPLGEVGMSMVLPITGGLVVFVIFTGLTSL